MVAKYPNLYRVRDGAPQWLRHSAVNGIEAACRRITGRTNTVAYFDRFRSAVCFGYETNGIPTLLDILVPLYRSSGADAGFDPVLDRYSEDDVVTLIQLGKVDPKLKAKWARWHENRRKTEAEKERDKMLEDGRSEVAARMQSRRERMAMGRYYRGRAVVNGLKTPR